MNGEQLNNFIYVFMFFVYVLLMIGGIVYMVFQEMANIYIVTDKPLDQNYDHVKVFHKKEDALQFIREIKSVGSEETEVYFYEVKRFGKKWDR